MRKLFIALTIERGQRKAIFLTLAGHLSKMAQLWTTVAFCSTYGAQFVFINGGFYQ